MMRFRLHAPRSFAPVLGLVLAASALGGASSASAQVVGTAADAEDLHRLLVIVDEKTMKPERLTTFKGKIVSTEPSTTGKYIGAMVVDPDSAKDGLFRFKLYILNTKGRTIYEVDDAQGFDFSPDDRYVAVTTGQPLEGATGFRPESTTVVDLRTKKQWTIPELTDATEIDWTTLPDDGLSLMAKRPTGAERVWKYRVARKQARAAGFKSIHFSPDGKYYYMTPREAIDDGLCDVDNKDDSCIRAYSWKNKEVKLRLQQRFRRAMAWAGRSGHDLLVQEGWGDQEKAMQIDLASGRTQILKERLSKRWKSRAGVRITEEEKGRIRMHRNSLFDELDRLRRRRRGN